MLHYQYFAFAVRFRNFAPTFSALIFHIYIVLSKENDIVGSRASDRAGSGEKGSVTKSYHPPFPGFLLPVILLSLQRGGEKLWGDDRPPKK